MQMTTHYEALAVDPSASTEEIKMAYRRLIRMHHPDLVGSSDESEATTRLLTEAFACLSDPSARRDYDRELLPEPEPEPEPEPAPRPAAPHRTAPSPAPSSPPVTFSLSRYKILSRIAIVSLLGVLVCASVGAWFTLAGTESALRPVFGLFALLPVVIAFSRRPWWPLLVFVGLGSLVFPLYLASIWPGPVVVDAGIPVWILAVAPSHAILATAFRFTVRPALAQRKARPRRG